MPANVYECMFLIDTGKAAGDVTAVDRQVRGILEKNNAEVLVSRPWDERRLSYPVKKQKKGLYYLTYFSADGTSLPQIDHDCKLAEMILRQLVIRIEPKLVETMLSIAKGEHATALHNMHEEGSEESSGTGGAPAGGGEGKGDEDGGPRRGRRNEPRE